MRQLFGFLLVVAITLLQACGGASNRDQLAAQTPTTPTTSTTLFTTAPASITFLSGAASGAYTISGGVAPYGASSSNAAVAAVNVSGNGLSITPGAVGSATVFLLDSAGTRIELAITVGSSIPVTALRTTAASAVTFGNGGSGTFIVAGGVLPYSTSSSNTAVAASSISGTTLSIVGGQVAGTAQVLVIDATGTQVVISVTVGSVAAQALFTSVPGTVTLASNGGTGRFVIGGGLPPYAASTSNAAVASATVSGTALTITAGNIGSATILVLDSLGAKVEIALTVGSAGEVTPLRTTAPATLTLGTNQTASYVISGGSSPYVTSSSNPGLVGSIVVGNTVTITSGLAVGTAQVLVIDSAGTQVIVAVTVSTTAALPLFTSAPSTVTMASGAAPATFTVGGGVAPYSASSSNVGNATATVTGTTLSVSSVSVGSATIALVDALGAKVEFTVTVGSSTVTTPLRTDAPSALTLLTGNERSYTVAGGQGPYAANSANEAVATASLAGNALKVTAVGAGTTQVLVFDASGTQVLIGVTVGGTTPTALFLAAPASVTVSTGAAPATYSIGGGTPPYSAQASNAAVASVSVSGATLSVSGLSVGSASVSIFDATGAQIALLVSVSGTSSVALSAAPSGASGNVGDVLTFTLHGGSPAYSMLSNNTNIATLSAATLGVDGGSFTATLLNVGQSIVTVRDSLGQTTSFVVSVTSSTPQLRVSPSAFVVGENENAAITLNVYGGTAPYRVLTSDLVKSSASVTGSVVTTQPGTSTNRCINPVTDATPPVYIRSGTYDVTYTIIDSLGAFATSVMTIRDNGAGDGVGCP